MRWLVRRTGQQCGKRLGMTTIEWKNTKAGAQIQDEIVVRSCNGMDELQACTDLEKQIWNFSDRDVVPTRLNVVAQHIGGQVIGAFHNGNLAGFAMSLPGVHNGRPYLHSRALAVSEKYRNAGLGRKLKLFQREDALAKEFDLIEWTFDPLEIKNAYLNIERLGAIIRRYQVNHYGSFSSGLQCGLPSDRLVAEWWLRSPRVETLLQSGTRPTAETARTISVPAEITKWKASAQDRQKALEVQLRNRELFQKAFSDKLVVLGYRVDAMGNGEYHLGRWDEAK